MFYPWSGIFSTYIYIYISIKTALNDAMNGKFMVKLDHYDRTRLKYFYIGPSLKFALTIVDGVCL